MGKFPLYDWWHKWYSKRNNERFIDRDTPVPVILVNTMGSAGQTIFGDSATAGPKLAVLDDNSTANEVHLGNVSTYTQRDYFGNRLLFEGHNAAGTAVSLTTTPAPWKPIPSVVGSSTVITADGSGNIGAAADIITAVAAKQLDIWAIIQVDTTGAYQTQFGEDPTGTLAATTPDYFTANHSAYYVAGYPYILRNYTSTANKGFGYGAGTNGEWPNSANMYITGWYREM